MPKKVVQPVRESDIQKAIIDLLGAYRIPVFRMNAGDRFGSHNGKKWRIRGHEPGTADLLAAPHRLGMRGAPQWLWIEVKKPDGRLTELQREFGNYVTECGMAYLVATSLDRVKEWLEEHHAI